jgi:hypothetical protein
MKSSREAPDEKGDTRVANGGRDPKKSGIDLRARRIEARAKRYEFIEVSEADTRCE